MDVSGFARSLVVEFLFASDRLPRSWAFRGLQLAGYDVSPCELRKATVETADLTIAPHCFVNRRFRIEGRGAVLIGSYTMIGPEVMITTSTHYRQPNGRLQVESTYLPVRIGENCWIGARAQILPGVTIGDDVTVAAGAIVVSDIGPGGLYGGVPARRIK